MRMDDLHSGGIMKITLLVVGKIKEKFYVEAIEEYKKRLSRYCKIEIIESADEKTPDHASEVQEEQIRQKEDERIVKYLTETDAYRIILAIDGKMLDSVELSEKIEKLGLELGMTFSDRLMTALFVIGGSLGLCREVQRLADYKLSFSKMTFPHQLMRIILLEQIYRSYRILNHEPYHK